MRAEELKTIVVIGAGIMGQQIAMNTAIKGRASGYQVILCDSFPAAVEKAQAWADKYLAGRVAKGRLTQEQVDDVKANLTITGDARLVILNAKEQTPRRTTGESSIAFIFLP